MWGFSPLLYLSAAALKGDRNIAPEAAVRKAHKALKEIARLTDEDNRKYREDQRKRNECLEQARKLAREHKDILKAKAELVIAQEAHKKEPSANLPIWELERSFEELTKLKTNEIFAQLTKKAKIFVESSIL